jgi:hypothetical protein
VTIRTRPESEYPLCFKVGTDPGTYRLLTGAHPFELEKDGTWKRVILSEEDYLHLKEVRTPR